MKAIKDKLLDILLFPVKFYEKITDKKGTLYAGILLVGAIDLLLPDIMGIFEQLFKSGPSENNFFNAFMLPVAIVLTGAVDVICIGLPLYDFFNFLKKKEIGYIGHESDVGIERELPPDKSGGIQYTATAIKTMKIYVMSHFLIIPVNTLLHYVFFSKIGENPPVWVANLALAYFMLVFIWAAAIMARGINTLFRFNPIFKRLTFIIVFAWNFLFGMVFDMQIMNWITRLFR